MNTYKEPLTPTAIIRLLSMETADRRPAVKAVKLRSSMSNLLLALKQAPKSRTKEILCDVLGSRHDPHAVPLLLETLTSHSPGVRAAAADALAKIGSPVAGPILLRRFRVEHVTSVRQMLALALGATRYRPSINMLIKSLNEKSGTLRGCAAWSLGKLGARNADMALRQALTKEKNDYAANRIKAALAEIRDS